jgi:hypothetical protein
MPTLWIQNTMATFQYFPLNESLREIRLLVLHSASLEIRESVLEMSLIKTRLGDHVKYRALSYTWGDPEPTYLVLLGGKSFSIRRNLLEALLQLRPVEDQIEVWVDAICINQDDTKERESQVALMRDIYKEAEHVCVWLGPGDGIKGGMAFSFLCSLAGREWSDFSKNIYCGQIARPETLQWTVSEMVDDTCLQQWLNVAAVLDSPWFSRMWIIQEVVLGKKVLVRRGNYETAWEYIYLAGRFMEKYLVSAVCDLVLRTAETPLRNDLVKKLVEKSDMLSFLAHRIAEIGRARNALQVLPEFRDRNVSYLSFLPQL